MSRTVLQCYCAIEIGEEYDAGLCLKRLGIRHLLGAVKAKVLGTKGKVCD